MKHKLSGFKFVQESFLIYVKKANGKAIYFTSKIFKREKETGDAKRIYSNMLTSYWHIDIHID